MCHSIRSMFRVLGIYNFGETLTWPDAARCAPADKACSSKRDSTVYTGLLYILTVSGPAEMWGPFYSSDCSCGIVHLFLFLVLIILPYWKYFLNGMYSIFWLVFLLTILFETFTFLPSQNILNSDWNFHFLLMLL